MGKVKKKKEEKLNIVTEARLHIESSSELISYFEDYVTEFNKMARFVWSRVVKMDCNRNELSQEVMQKYGVLKRVANSIVGEMIGRLNALKELKQIELTQKELKIKEIEEKRDELLEDMLKLKPLVTENKASFNELAEYRKLKMEIHYKNKRLNKYRDRAKQLELDIKIGNYRMTFGTQDLFDKQNRLEENGYKSHLKWRNDFIKYRDKNITYLGSSDEDLGNQLVKFEYDYENDLFNIKVRGHGKEKEYFNGQVKIRYKCYQLVKQLEEGKTPLTYRILRRGKKWYIQVILTLFKIESEDKVEDGVIGLDYNKGFISLVSVDSKGDIIEVYDDVKLEYHGTGNKAKSEIEEAVSKIVIKCKILNKSLVIEDLDFKKKKAASGKGRNKGLNKMIHLFDYGRYKEVVERACFRNGVKLSKINPWNTSKLGQKYIEEVNKEMSVHQGAAYYIGRRGLGIKDVI